MSIAEFLNLISKNYVSACSLFSPIYDNNKKRRASALKILEHIKNGHVRFAIYASRRRVIVKERFHMALKIRFLND
jgi:hypothetical protein